MSVTVHPNHTTVGSPTWDHFAERETSYGSTIPAVSSLRVMEGDHGASYTLTLPDHVWRQINERLTEHFASAEQAEDETPDAAPGAAPDERWIAEGGYSPDRNAFLCPIDGCGFGVAGLNSEPDPDDAYTGDPVAEHYAERHPGVQLAVDQAGIVAPIVEATDTEPVRTMKPGDRCRILDEGATVQHFGCDEHADGVFTDARTGKVVRKA